MGTISKFSGKDIADVNKIDGVLKSSTSKVSGQEIPADSLLLDTYTGAVAAYSIRRLNSLYTGACMRVRRASDNTETDIDFDSNGYVDTSAIATHCGSSIGYVTKWYGQESSGGTGSGNDATQTTTSQQPRIYSGSSVYTDGSLAAITTFNTANGSIGLDLDSNLRTTNGPSSVFIVYNVDQRYSTQFQNVYSLYRTQRAVVGRTTNTVVYEDVSISDAKGVASDRRFRKFSNTTETLNQSVMSSLYDGTSEESGKPVIEMRENGVSPTSNPGGTGGFNVPASGINSIMYREDGNTQGVDGTIQEFIVYDTYLSSDRADIESNIQTYFSIT